MIYLNKTCFNGLWRVNSRGFYNVPMGRYPKPTICQEDVLRKASEALQGVCIKHASYLEIIRAAASGDLVYFDPPYMPVSPTASFNAYAKEGFSAEDHQELALVFLFLALQGVFVLLSNSDTPFTRLPFGAKDDFRAFSKCVQAVYARQPFQDVALKDLFTAYQERWQVQTVRATRAINSRASARGAITELLISSHVCV
jgi:DNA adenine methylase